MDKLEKINKFTRRQLEEDEIYTFDVILCDNKTDRDGEKFSDNAFSDIASRAAVMNVSLWSLEIGPPYPYAVSKS